MFGLEKNMDFMKSLVTDKAGQFSKMIASNVSRTGNTADLDISRSDGVVENAVRQAPDMVLPEDSGSVGSQIMGEVRNIPPEHALRSIPDQAQRVFSGSSSMTTDVPRETQDIGSHGGQREILPTREIMNKKLNHFQIERLAEQIKERLESEIKVEKERHGEEP